MELTLTHQEAELLREILESDLGDLRMEISGTDSQEFREQLKQREVLMKDLLRRLA